MSDTSISSEFSAVTEDLDLDEIQPFFRKRDEPAPNIEDLAKNKLPFSQTPEEPNYSDICAYLRRKDAQKAEKAFNAALEEIKTFCSKNIGTVPPPRGRRRK